MGPYPFVAPSAASPPARPSSRCAAGLTACAGLDAGIDYPSDLPSDLGPHLLSPENQRDPPHRLQPAQVRAAACDKVDTHTITTPLNQEDFTRFLEAQGVKIEPRKARNNLYWYDFPNGEAAPKNFVRLRLAVLEDSPHASADLHQSILEHGPGWWGVRRSNLALLAPKAELARRARLRHQVQAPLLGDASPTAASTTPTSSPAPTASCDLIRPWPIGPCPIPDPVPATPTSPLPLPSPAPAREGFSLWSPAPDSA